MSTTSPTHYAALIRAIEIAGGPTALSVAVRAPSAGAVKQWRISGVPAAYCPAIEKATGIRCEELRPDIEWGVLRGTSRRPSRVGAPRPAGSSPREHEAA